MTRGDKRPLRLVLFAALFLALTVGGAAWAIIRADVSLENLARLGDLSAGVLALLAGLSVAVFVVDILRYQLLGRAVGEPLDVRAAFDASVANFFFGWLTPGAAFGAPGSIYMLHRRGVSWDGAALIAFGKSLTGTAVLLLLAFVMLVLGIGPRLDSSALTVILPGAAIVVGLLVLLVMAAFRPERSLALVEQGTDWLGRRRFLRDGRPGQVLRSLSRGVASTITRLAALRAGGPRPLLWFAVSHLLYFAVFIAIAAVLVVSLGAGSGAGAMHSSGPGHASHLIAAFGISTVYVAFTYVAPTPGGSGLAEATAIPFYGDLLPPDQAVIAVLLFRALTFYLQIAVGLVYLPLVAGIGDIARGVRDD